LTKLFVVRVGKLKHLFVIDTISQGDELVSDHFELLIRDTAEVRVSI